MDAMVPRVQSVLVDIGLDDRVGLNIDRVSATIGLDAKSEVCVGIHIPVKATEEPETAIPVAERRISYSQ